MNQESQIDTDSNLEPHDLSNEQSSYTSNNTNYTDTPKTHYDTPGTMATYSTRDVETASELNADDINESEQNNAYFNIQTNSIVGWIAIALSTIAFFWLPILFGAAGVFVGFLARNRRANVLGNIAITAGIIAIIMSFFWVR